MGDEEETAPSQEIDFCTLGMFIIGKKILRLAIRVWLLPLLLKPRLVEDVGRYQKST